LTLRSRLCFTPAGSSSSPYFAGFSFYILTFSDLIRFFFYFGEAFGLTNYVDVFPSIFLADAWCKRAFGFYAFILFAKEEYLFTSKNDGSSSITFSIFLLYFCFFGGSSSSLRCDKSF
jgi:hypothetical protein